MATCAVQDLMDDANCFFSLAGVSQWEAVELTLLCKILQAADPMASCDVQDLMDDAKCFNHLGRVTYADMIRLQLLCEILNALGGGGGGSAVVQWGDADPNIAPADPTDGVIYVQTVGDGISTIWYWDSDSSTWK